MAELKNKDVINVISRCIIRYACTSVLSQPKCNLKTRRRKKKYTQMENINNEPTHYESNYCILFVRI